MKCNAILFCLFFVIAVNTVNTVKAQAVDVNDSLALVDLYASTDGLSWSDHTNWLTTASINTWYGVTVTNDRVTGINLDFNNLNGPLPAAIGNLTALISLFLTGNDLTGTIPAAIGNLVHLQSLFINRNSKLHGSIPYDIGNLIHLETLDLSLNDLHGKIPASFGKLANLRSLYLFYNQLSGAIPTSFSKLANLQTLYLYNNQLSQETNVDFPNISNHNVTVNLNNNLFTFDGMEFVDKKFPNANYGLQAKVFVHQTGNILSVYAGGTLSNNTYTWSLNGNTIAIITGDSTLPLSSNGRYAVKVTNAVAKQLTLSSLPVNFTTNNIITNKSITATASNTHFTTYPNPATNLIHLQTNGTATFTLTNNNGKVLLTKTINNSNVINVSKYAGGTYYIQNKTTGETQKIVVVH